MIVTILDGEAQIEIDHQTYNLNVNQSIRIPANIPHAVYAINKFKMLLTIFTDHKAYV